MLENLKSLDLFKDANATSHAPFAAANPQNMNHTQTLFGATQRALPTGIYNTTNSIYYPALKQYTPTRFPPFGFPALDQRRFYSLGELYLSQQLERSSAFQYVQQANHLRQLNAFSTNRSNVPGNLPLSVK